MSKENVKWVISQIFSPQGTSVLIIIATLIFTVYAYDKQSTLGDSPEDWKIGCAGAVEGQTVLKASYMMKSMAVTKLTPDGKIIPCDKDTYKEES